ETRLDLAGFPVTVADTAGLREIAGAGDAQGEIEREGIRRALARADAADLKILVLDATVPPDPAVTRLADRRTLVIANKTDLAAGVPELDGQRVYPISVRTGAGMTAFMDALGHQVAGLLSAQGDSAPVVTRARHRAALEECAAALIRARAGSA